MSKLQYLVTVDISDDEAEDFTDELKTYLSHIDGCSVERYTAPSAVTSGRTHDAYGNPYNRDTVDSATHDKYGNPYNKENKPPEPGERDAYGNLHK